MVCCSCKASADAAKVHTKRGQASFCGHGSQGCSIWCCAQQTVDVLDSFDILALLPGCWSHGLYFQACSSHDIVLRTIRL